MKTCQSRAVIFVCCAVLASAAFSWAQPESEGCSNRTLEGDYAFTVQGDLIIPVPVPHLIPLRGVAMTHFDGEGNLSQVDHVLANGVPPAVEWRPGVGTYSVNPDCTGAAQINIEGRPPLNLRFVIAAKGKEIHTVVADAGSASFSIGIRR